ncbi:hypothetical protein PIB30_001889 [Stylosanthes scabra]|uniref:DUF4283 domain-containing protein n=1 Tax=Stylosanthes scabra TaxID=79078 RepID=A0ABU6X0E5_9FABA|nr:hypothetical protein [Stylosanthes scabra]
MGKGNGKLSPGEDIQAIGDQAKPRHSNKHDIHRKGLDLDTMELVEDGDEPRRILSQYSWIISPLMLQTDGYATRNEASRAIEQLNGWLVWGNSIIVTESKYRKVGEERPEVKKKNTEGYRGENLGDANRTDNANKTHNHQRSYKDALEAGKMTSGIMDPSKMEMELKKEWSTLEESSNTEANRTRRSWIEVLGLPVQGCWTTENMRKIAEVWGRVLKIEEDEGGHYNSFRVLVDSNFGPGIQSFAKVVLDEEDEYLIYIREVATTQVFMDGRCKPATSRNVDEAVHEKPVLPPIIHGKGEKSASMVKSVRVVEAMDIDTQRSRVEESQAPWENGTNEDDDGAHVSNSNFERPNGDWASPTRTKSLDDDRQTDEVI